MTIVANNSIDTYGADANIHGLNVAFICMSIGTLIMFAISVFLVKEDKK